MSLLYRRHWFLYYPLPVCPLCHSMMYSLMIPIPPINYFPATTPTRAGYPLIPVSHSPIFSPHRMTSRDVWFGKNSFSTFFSPLACLTLTDWCMKVGTESPRMSSVSPSLIFPVLVLKALDGNVVVCVLIPIVRLLPVFDLFTHWIGGEEKMGVVRAIIVQL